MAYRSKLYKQLNCRDFRADCDFMVRAKTAEEVMEYSHAHSCKVHGKCESSHETEERVRSLINNVWL
jgi:predicted small metal-binding protein